MNYPDEVTSFLPDYNNNANCSFGKNFHFGYALPEEISAAVHSIKSNSKGVDMMPIRFVKLCLPVIVPVLESIFNFSLQNSCFPDIWKLANVTPLAKVKNPSE